MLVFIDTNIYLAFYHLSSDELEELKKIAVLLEQEQLTLFVTDQVKNEFARNRETKIADALKRLREQRLNLSFPQMCKDYPDYAALRQHQKDYEVKHAALLEKMQADILANQLKADGVIATLFEKATILKTTAEIVTKARLRMDLGNPPGKDRSLGDAVNWELLLAHVPDGGHLNLISDDRDFASPLDEEEVNQFLDDEWTSAKHSDLYLYKRLSLFFKDEFPDIKLATELEKELWIQKLASSSNFATTHGVIGKLANYAADFTAAQANAVVAVALANKQVGWIIKDDDVEEFYRELLQTHEANIDAQNLQKLKALLDPSAHGAGGVAQF
jgi:predicted nucleic acid-binding protein